MKLIIGKMFYWKCEAESSDNLKTFLSQDSQVSAEGAGHSATQFKYTVFVKPKRITASKQDT